MKFYLAAIALCALLIPNNVHAAYFFADSESNSFHFENEYTVNIELNSENKAVNAVTGFIFFENKNVDIVHIDTAKSVLDLWTVKPIMVNNSVHFEGLILNPGYNGTSGHIFSLKFRTKKMGDESLVFSGTSILANDGKGTNVLTKNKNFSFSISPVKDPLDMKIVRAGNSKSVYLIKNNRRLVFLNDRIYKTWFADFKDVVVVSESVLANYLIGGFVKPKPNMLMFKITTDPRVYLVSEKGELRWLVNEAVAQSIFGSGWANQVVDISDAEIAGYALGKPITSKNDVHVFHGDLLSVE